MKKVLLFAIITPLLIIGQPFFVQQQSLASSGNITAEEALEMVSNCMNNIASASILQEHYSDLADLLQPSSWSLTPEDLDEFLNHVNERKEELKMRVLQFGSRGHRLENQIKNMTDKTCNPCLQSQIRHFCKNSEGIIRELRNDIEEVYQNIRTTSSAFSSAVLEYAQKKVKTNNPTLSADLSENVTNLLKQAEKLHQSGNHPLVIDKCIELFSLFIPLK